MRITPIVLPFLLFACTTGPDRRDDRYDYLGQAVRPGDSVAAAEVIADPDHFDGKTVRISGRVHEVCKKKGCWVRVGTAEGNVLVRTNYAFLLPTDCEGREIIVEGKVEKQMMPVEDARHVLEDAGRTEEAAKITEPVPTVSMSAAGVALRKDG